jgi:adenosylmethionine---8-amino-7-oxononanoate aminotransferase
LRDHELIQLDRRHVWHPYTQHGSAPEPLVIRGAKGAFLYGHDDRTIFDGISSWWVTLHGHAQPEIAKAISEQARVLEQVIFTDFTHEPAAALANELSTVLPGKLTRCFFSDDGSTAVEVALKLAIQYWSNAGEKRPLVAALENAYHGDTFGAMSVSGRGLFTAPFQEQLFEVVRLPDPSIGDVLEAIDRLIADRGGELAAVIVEPLLLGAGGMRMYGEQLLRDIVARVRASGALFVADEVLTGFGRTGPLFACDRAKVKPDVICLSKGLTGGFLPLGVTAVREEIFERFVSAERSQMFFHGHSYTANPIACAAARASLKLLDDASQLRRDKIEAVHRDQLACLSTHPKVRNTRVLGTIGAFDLADSSGYLDSRGRELADYALRNNVLLRPLGGTVYLLPPFCTIPEELTYAYQVIANFLELM